MDAVCSDWQFYLWFRRKNPYVDPVIITSAKSLVSGSQNSSPRYRQPALWGLPFIRIYASWYCINLMINRTPTNQQIKNFQWSMNPNDTYHPKDHWRILARPPKINGGVWSIPTNHIFIGFGQTIKGIFSQNFNCLKHIWHHLFHILFTCFRI